MKYTERGQIVISAKYLENAGNTEISVKDTGIGMKGEALNHLFELYSRGYKGNSELGTGVGLTLCKYLAENMRGNINLESEVGSGTIVTLLIPTPIVNHSFCNFSDTQQFYENEERNWGCDANRDNPIYNPIIPSKHTLPQLFPSQPPQLL